MPSGWNKGLENAGWLLAAMRMSHRKRRIRAGGECKTVVSSCASPNDGGAAL